jgi:hypothetical protein
MDGLTVFTILYIALSVYIYNVYASFIRHGISIKN